MEMQKYGQPSSKMQEEMLATEKKLTEQKNLQEVITI